MEPKVIHYADNEKLKQVAQRLAEKGKDVARANQELAQLQKQASEAHQAHHDAAVALEMGQEGVAGQDVKTALERFQKLQKAVQEATARRDVVKEAEQRLAELREGALQYAKREAKAVLAERLKNRARQLDGLMRDLKQVVDAGMADARAYQAQAEHFAEGLPPEAHAVNQLAQALQGADYATRWLHERVAEWQK